MHRPVDAGSVAAKTAGPIHPDTSIGTVRLTVSDLARSVSFYEDALGLRATDGEDGTAALRAGDDRVLIELHPDSAPPARDPRSPGLYHLAVLMPDRPALAKALARLGSARWPLGGASDHLVSEALYLADPDGNGIEIYRDRPQDQWPRQDGTVAMATLPLDLKDLLDELDESDQIAPLAPTGTRMGHVHLQVSDLAEAEAFYAGILGFEVTVRTYPGALFVSAGGYHHHIGLNTWQSAGAEPGRPGSVGLRSFEVVLPDDGELDRVLRRIHAAGLETEPTAQGSLVRDPSGNGVLLSAT